MLVMYFGSKLTVLIK